ncbi:MmgE/PrpD family protein [Halobium salinum]|uniref:MmgE/PrpD family protein n=1 Tax=Halobium salinum TaxID=1364940 RepID=A0ABD5PHS6_9EURY|nr:MmgE/PrpD family protein [Halobium salinum]
MPEPREAAAPERTLASFVADLTFEDVPTGAVNTIERAFVDTVGVTLAGAVEGAGDRANRVVRATSAGSDGVSLLGVEGSASVAEAAFANGTAGHALDYDDLSWAMDGHPSVTLVAPALAVGEHVGASGPALVTAFAAGFEAECYLAEPISPTHYEQGWHPTATFGVFGAAAAAASLLDLDAEATERALNVAASTPAGLKRNFGSMTKPVHAGLAGRSGVTAALLAAEGVTAGDAVVSGERGFWDRYADGDEREADPPGAPWRLVETGISVKKYPCCYFAHTSLAVAADLVERNGVDPEAVDRVEATVSRGAGDALVYPDPATGLEAKFSMEYALACGVARDRVGLAAFEDEALSDSEVERVRERAGFDVDESLPYKSNHTRVRIVAGEETYEGTMERPPGTPENPMSERALREKFVDCATRAVPEPTAATAFDRFRSLREQDGVRDLLGSL